MVELEMWKGVNFLRACLVKRNSYFSKFTKFKWDQKNNLVGKIKNTFQKKIQDMPWKLKRNHRSLLTVRTPIEQLPKFLIITLVGSVVASIKFKSPPRNPHPQNPFFQALDFYPLFFLYLKFI